MVLLPIAVIRHGILANHCGEETLHSVDQLDNCEPLKEYYHVVTVVSERCFK